ncbi:MAG: hypothetical protein U9N42_08395 [Campylobacterota bacterium]|nr:hypothetical protein [Campylobacterota bacterium]
MDELKLHDIKPLVEINDTSFTLFVITCSVATILILGALYLIYKFIKNYKKVNIRRERYKKLTALDLENTKKTAYLISSLGFTFKDDSQRVNEAYNNLVNKLEAYKYKKEIEPFNDEVKSYYNIFIGMIDA